MNMKQNKLGASALVSLLLLAVLTVTGCPSQSAIAALTGTLGSAAASIAAIEGNTVLATQLQGDTAAAVTVIKNWKPGTPAQNAVQALNVVIADLTLICPPANATCTSYMPLVILATGTAQSIILILEPSAPVLSVGAKKANLATYPKSASQFKAQWNSICKSNPDLANATLK